MRKVKKKVKRKKKLKKEYRRKRFRVLLIVIVLVYFLIMGLPVLRGSTAKTIAVSDGEVTDTTTSKAIISKDEIVYRSKAQGNIVFAVKEGEKISKNTKVAQSKNTSNAYTANQAGIVSMTLDGYESKFSSKNIDEIKPSDFKALEVKKTVISADQELEVGQGMFKIIENQNWYIITRIENEKLDKLKKGDKVSININKSEEKKDATVYKIGRSKEDVFLILEMDKYLHDFYKERYVDLKITKDVYSGLKVPQNSIIEKDGTKGVFIKDISGVVKFRPVNIMKKTKNTTLVEPVDGQTPLKLFDEVFTDGKKVKEGQLVNSKGGV